MKKWIWILISISLVFSQQKMTKKIEISDENGLEKKVEVQVKIDNGNASVEVTRDGKTEKFEFPMDKIDEPAIQKKLAEMGIDNRDLGLEEDPGKPGGYLWEQFPFLAGPKSYLGVQLQDLTDQLRTYFKLDRDGGVLISEVIKDSPAASAKLRAGDIILQVDDTRISDADELRDLVSSLEPETTVEIQYYRKGKVKTTRATLEERQTDDFSWFGKGFQMPAMPQWNGHNFMFFPDDEDSTEFPEDLREEMKAMRKELDILREQVDNLRDQ